MQLTITSHHIARLKEHRFLTGWFPSLDAYLAAPDSTGWLKAGTQLTFRGRIELEPYAGIYVSPYRGGMGHVPWHGLCSIGTQSYSHSALPEGLVVGRYCSIANGLAFLDSQHPHTFVSTAHFAWRPGSVIVAAANADRGLPTHSVPHFDLLGGKPYPVIGNDVWIGQNVTLAMGITIGDGAVVAANSTITKAVPPYAIVGGNPARVIRMRFPEPLVARLLAARWWESLFTDFRDLPFDDPAAFLDAFEARRPPVYQPPKLVLPDAFVASKA